MKKSQSSLLVLVSLVGIFTIAWIFSSFSSFSSSQRIIEGTLLSKIMKYLDYIKAYTRNALILSVHAETKYIASQGGQSSNVGLPRSWICNGDVSPFVDDVRFFLSNKTTSDLNAYIKNFDIQDLPTINITNSTCVDYDVNQNTVFSGINDERFEVGSYGSKANVTLESNTVFSDNEVYEEIAQDRFWYMYRNFKEWMPTAVDIIVGGTCNCLPYICNCPGSPQYTSECEFCGDTCSGFQSCLQNIVDLAREALVNTFDDEYVDCTARLIGCYHELEPCIGTPQCTDWENAPACFSCYRERTDKLCAQSVLSGRPQETGSLVYSNILLKQSYPAPGNRIYFADVCTDQKCERWAETRGSMEALFSCTDNKYFLSVVGDRHLSFSVHVRVKLKSMNCWEEEPCKESNGECVCPSGTWCTECTD